MSEQLFDDLSSALKAPAPPESAVLLAEFKKWERFVPTPGPNVLDKATVACWLDAYAAVLTQKETAKDAYASSVARLLRGEGATAAVPFVVARQNNSSAQVLRLELISISGGVGGFWLHPSFAHRRADTQAETGRFLAAITGAWSLACAQASQQPTVVDVFWRLTTDDGGALPAIQLDGPSASAAAFRAFWHVTRGLQIDPDVYVMADAMSSDGRIAAVGDLRQKIKCVQAARSSLGGCPPTLIVAQYLTEDDLASCRGATDWAECKQVATLDELVSTRSCTAHAVIVYLEQLAGKLDETPWKQNGKDVLLSDVHVPPQVWKDDTSFRHTAEEGKTEREQDWRPPGYEPAGAEREVAPRLTQQRPKILLPWATAFQRQQGHPIVVVGGPGFGKTSLLHWTAREMALASLIELNDRSKGWSDVRWPIVTSIAVWLGKGGDAHDALRSAAVGFSPLSKTHHALRRAAVAHVIEKRLTDSTEHTHLFLDALDQVPATQLKSLNLWLGQLPSLTPRLVISIRQAALTTHLSKMPLFRPTILEAAALSTEEARALAAKWLDPVLAARLEAHLRAQPAMSVVADSPLLLTLACGIIARKPDASLPETAAYLYRDLMLSLARGEWLASTEVGPLDADALLARLRPMAWRLFSRDAGTNRFSHDAVIRSLNGGNSVPDQHIDGVLSQLCRFGFLEKSGQSEGESHYQFRHTTFLEFLAAAHLAGEINAEDWAQAQVAHWRTDHGWQSIKISEMLDAKAYEPAWEPLFAFTAGLLRHPKPLLEMLADRSKDDIYKYRLGLLCRCYGALAPDKEDELERLMDRVLPIIERMGRNARRRHPDRWKGWLVTAGYLLNLPKSGTRAAKFLERRDDHEDHMRQDSHGLLDILAKTAQNARANAAIDALLAICERGGHHGELADASQKAVELAEKLGLVHVIKRLELAMDAAVEKPDNQIDLAKSLLRVRDARVAQKAFDLLNALAENAGVENWCRNRAVGALVDTLDTPLEAQGAALLAQKLFSSSDNVFSKTYWDGLSELTRSIAWSAERNRSKITFALVCMLLRAAPNSNSLSFMLGEALVRWDDAEARRLGSELLLAQLRRQSDDLHDSSRRDDAAKLIIECGSNAEREEAQLMLKSVLRGPIGDGRQRLLAVSALLEAGNFYDSEIKQCLREIAMTDDVHLCWIIRSAEIATERQDTGLFEILAPRLHWIIANAKTHVTRNEPSYSERRDAAKLFFGTDKWLPLETKAFALLRGDTPDRDGALKGEEDWFSVHVICFGAKSTALIEMTERLLAVGKRNFCPWVPLMRELAFRGWRFQISRRKFVIFRRGQEEPRADAEFGY